MRPAGRSDVTEITMEELNTWEGLLLVVIVLAVIFPYVRIIRRAGFSAWWILVTFVPILNFIMLWVFAFIEWPALQNNRDRMDGR
jgi:uncharacterized membrane protein YhaH (DUF805 family)